MYVSFSIHSQYHNIAILDVSLNSYIYLHSRSVSSKIIFFGKNATEFNVILGCGFVAFMFNNDLHLYLFIFVFIKYLNSY